MVKKAGESLGSLSITEDKSRADFKNKSSCMHRLTEKIKEIFKYAYRYIKFDFLDVFEFKISKEDFEKNFKTLKEKVRWISALSTQDDKFQVLKEDYKAEFQKKDFSCLKTNGIRLKFSIEIQLINLFWDVWGNEGNLDEFAESTNLFIESFGFDSILNSKVTKNNNLWNDFNRVKRLLKNEKILHKLIYIGNHTDEVVFKIKQSNMSKEQKMQLLNILKNAAIDNKKLNSDAIIDSALDYNEYIELRELKYGKIKIIDFMDEERTYRAYLTSKSFKNCSEDYKISFVNNLLDKYKEKKVVLFWMSYFKDLDPTAKKILTDKISNDDLKDQNSMVNIGFIQGDEIVFDGLFAFFKEIKDEVIIRNPSMGKKIVNLFTATQAHGIARWMNSGSNVYKLFTRPDELKETINRDYYRKRKW